VEPQLKVYLDRLRGGKEELIEATLSPSFIDVIEKDLKFGHPISIKGKAYLTNDHLIIQLKVETKATLPCSICNQQIDTPVVVPKFYITEEISGIKGHVYQFINPLREALLLEVPVVAECQGGCPQRKELEKYKPSEGNDDSAQFPFADLN